MNYSSKIECKGTISGRQAASTALSAAAGQGGTGSLGIRGFVGISRRVAVGSQMQRQRSPWLTWGSRVGVLILSMSPYDAELGLPLRGVTKR